MIVDETDGRVVLQPETRREEHITDRLFSRLQDAEFDELTSWYTLDVSEYDALDTGLARRRAQQDPLGPGTRVLVVVCPGEVPS